MLLTRRRPPFACRVYFLMNVCHVVPSLDPSHGGPPVVASRLAAAQAALGHMVSILSYDTPDERGAIERSMRDIPGAERLRLISLQPPQGQLASIVTPASLVRGIDDAIGSSAVVHLHGVWESIIRLAAKSARRLNIPYIVAPHGMLDPWSLAQKALKKKIALALFGYRTMLKHAAFLHVLNADEQTLLAPLGLPARMEVIPNGIFLAEIDGALASQPDGQSNDEPFVLFLSRVHYKKGLDYLADAFAQLRAKRPEWQLVVAGPDGGERRPFEERVARLNLNGSVRVVGPVYGAEKFGLLRSAACFCLPSRQEGFSVAILEAMACRVPVVVSENCHFPEVAETGAGRIVRLDADAVAAALLDVASVDAVQRRQIGDAGRRLVEERFTWEKVAERSIQAYRRIK
jgi:glycosyltransferase involved in cell wall biosynthesis